jgi:hypothetical protein
MRSTIQTRGVATGALLAGGTLCMAAAAFAAAAKLAPNDIQTNFFTGQPFTASTPSGIKYTMVFTPDGKMTREPVGTSGAKSDGTWKLSADGFCTSWKNAKANCYTLVDSGKNKWSVMKASALMGTWAK